MISKTKHVHILFHVPEGLECIAKNEIITKLTSKLSPQEEQQSKIVADPNTGRVHLICQQTKLSTLITMIKQVHLLSVRDAIVIASSIEFPNQEFGDKEKTCQFISETASKTDFDPVLTALDYSSNDTEKPTTFRGTFYKEELKHGVKSPELASWIGHAFGQKYPDYKVKLEGYDYEIVGVWTRITDPALWDVSMDKQGGEILLLMGVTLKTKDTKYRNRQFFGKTSLNPCIAYCLAQVANPSPGQVVLDMCCGTGTIPIEGASCFPNVFWIGSEVHETTLCEKAKGNVQYAGVHNVELMLGDGRSLCFRDGSVDVVLTDWPWGIREGSFSTVQKLYPKFMKQIGRVLRSKGKAYIVTQGHKLFNRVLGYPWCKAMWNVDEIKPIAIGGHKVSLYILSKKV
ncbi:putative RNA methylase family UPF0020-domain-containing protein [Phascolomyces articulosus]|uniref:RNA methylase family UPF0020-domain-containing protein n=1 Tax=Phascolomyces articulosus TaxID=60185 RepID=A0AAD5PIM1_9FUNG|nr:putative RNA methylase family UPF0020-domain-containing protein [Phascolomyces articulosus]